MFKMGHSSQMLCHVCIENKNLICEGQHLGFFRIPNKDFSGFFRIPKKARSNQEPFIEIMEP